MTAVSSSVVRFGRYAVITAADETFFSPGDEPGIWAHVRRAGLKVEWEITAGKTGEQLAWGQTWTRGGAWVEAIAAAHRPGIFGGAR